MKVTARIDWKRWLIGFYIDSLTVAIFIGPIAIDFLYRWNQVQALFYREIDLDDYAREADH